MPEQQQKEQELKQAFIQHLPERLAAIDNDWKQLCRSDWNRQRAESLHHRLQSLTGSSGRFGLINLSESALSLELLLKMQIGDNITPDEKRIKTGQSLIEALHHETELLNRHGDTGCGNAKLIYLLDISDDLVPGLIGLLREKQYSVISFSHPDDLESELQKRLPDILIIGGGILSRITLLNRELAVQQELHKRRVAIICLSQNRDLEQRLLALRNGVDTYIVLPINSRELVEKVVELSSSETEPYRILIVEDDHSQADFAASILKKSGMKIHIITDPMDILNALDRFRPDLILMDLYMPNVDGIELTSIIREHPGVITTPIVFLSGEQDTDKQLQALSAGGDDFLSKPIRPHHLVNTLRNRIQRARTLEKRHRTPTTRDRESGLFTRRHFYHYLEEIASRALNTPVQGALLHLRLQPSTDPPPPSLHAGYLSTLGSIVSDLTEEQDIAARLDEYSFAILLLRPHPRAVQQLARRLLQRLDKMKSGDCYSPSIGIATFDGNLCNTIELLANAAEASRLAAETNQRIHLHPAPDNSGTASRIDNSQLPHMLQEALYQNSLQPFFTRLRANTDGTVQIHELGFRLLLSHRQQIGTSELLSLAMEQDLGTTLSQLLLGRALSTLYEESIEGKQSILFVRQTPDTIFQGRFTNWLRDQLRIRQMVGSGLVLEYRIAELSRDLRRVKHHFDQLHEMDIRVLLSRFGATPAALKVLDYLKADFVRVAGPILNAEPQQIKSLQQTIHSAGAKTVLPASRPSRGIAPAWSRIADIIPLADPTIQDSQYP